MRRSFFTVLFVGTLAISGCYYDNEEELYPVTSTDTSISYASVISPMITQNCLTAGCHVTGGQLPDLSNYQGVFDNKDKIKARAVDGVPSPMPASGLMSADNRNKLGKWIQRGANNN